MDAPQLLTFDVSGPPVPQPRARISTWGGRGRAYTPKGHPVTAYRQAIAIRAAMAAKAARWVTTTVPIEVEITCRFQRPPSHVGKRGLRAAAPAFPPKADVDNLAKAVLDAVTDSGAVWHDDDQVVRLVVSKAYAATAGVTVAVRAVPP